MKRLRFGLLFLLAGAAPAGIAQVEQTTGGWCSPAQNGNNNQVVCNGVDPRAMARLNELLDLKDLSLKQKTDEANGWARKYTELNAQFEETKKQLAAKGEDTTLVQTAQDLLHEGKLEEARKIYDRLIASDEGNVDRAARDHFSRATIFALQFRIGDALPDYARAYQYRPDDPSYAGDYAIALWRQKDYPKAETVLQRLVPQERTLAAQNPAANRPALAATLNNLGIVYRDTNRYPEAEAAYQEAIGIRRELAAQSPTAYRPDLAQTLNNLGTVYIDTNRYPEAEAAYKEAAGIRRGLAARDPAAYRPDLAATLNSLGILYRDTHRYPEAEAAYREAAGIWRELAAQSPAAYRPDLARTLNNLGTFYADTHRFAEAEAAYKEAAGIRR
ncbi:MAG: tetratricopeptide repeat protein, partial [Acetobacteraceae bacterium]|nr:tetratricopeptide repeat protein [Acetobacteraceae bacterium]